MNDLINFFALRPVFTHYGMKVVWYVYLFNAALQLYIAVNGVVRNLGAARHQLGDMVAKFPSSSSRNCCSTCTRSALSRSGSDHSCQCTSFMTDDRRHPQVAP